MAYFPNGLGYSLGDALLTDKPLVTSRLIYYVDSVNGSDVTGAGTRGNPYASLAEAYSDTGADDTIYILADNHAEVVATPLQITTRTAIIGAGSSGGQPTATLTTTAHDPCIEVGVLPVYLRNIKFAASSVANSHSKIHGAGGAGALMCLYVTGCRFETGENDTGVAAIYMDGAAGSTLHESNNSFVVTATTRSAVPASAVYAGAGVSTYTSRDSSFDGGLYGWSEHAVDIDDMVAGSIALIERATLLRGSTISTGGSSSSIITMYAPTGAAMLVEV